MKNSGIDLYHSIIIIVISVMSIVVYTGKKKGKRDKTSLGWARH